MLFIIDSCKPVFFSIAEIDDMKNIKILFNNNNNKLLDKFFFLN
jgi:hypothetical protein